MPDAQTNKKGYTTPFGLIWDKIRKLWRTEVNVYFISGMCYNCSVFDKLELPDGFNKKYIEWLIPQPDETLDKYCRRMAVSIDTSKPFILIGYSFGGVIVQEMNRFLNPLKSILISSFKGGVETPMSFRAIRRGNIVERIPESLYNSTEFVTNVFNQLIYHIPTADLSKYMTVTDPAYIRWAAKHITEWLPATDVKHLYHLHGTLDQIFPYEIIRDAFAVEGGDHLMILKKSELISSILRSILLIKEK